MALQQVIDDDLVNEGLDKINANSTKIPKLIDAVAGGAGFENISGTVELDLDDGREFHHTMTGNIDSLTFANIPTSDTNATQWKWELKIDATGGYTLSGTPTVDWRDGHSFDDLDLTANAVNTIFFKQVGSSTRAWLIDNDSIRLTDYVLSFGGDGTQYVPFEQSEDVDLANVKHRAPDGTAATGSLAFEKNGASVSGLTSFVENDTLSVIRSGSSAAAGVRIPAYLT